jgi:predicted acylesterase/phospholipase RssA
VEAPEPVEPPLPVSPSAAPAPLALTVAGGVSLGSYEAGYLYYLTETLKRNPEFFDVQVVTGASAGAANSLLTVLSLCGPQETDPERSVFYRAWIPVGLGELFRPEDVSVMGIFSKQAIHLALDQIEAAWDEGLPDACDIVWGVSTTRLAPIPVAVGDGAFQIPRLEEKFVVRIRGRGLGRVPLVQNYVDRDFGLEQPLLPIDGDPSTAFTSLRELMLASAAFPIAFAPQALRFCSTDPATGGIRWIPQDERVGTVQRFVQAGLRIVAGAEVSVDDRAFFSERDAPCTEDRARVEYFIDGGVFDNQPLRLAARVAEIGLVQLPDGSTAWADYPGSARTRVAPDLNFIYLDPSSSAFPTGREEGTRPELDSVFGLAMELFNHFVAAARSKEFYSLLEENPGIRNRIFVTRHYVPTVSGVLGAFFGFFEQEFRRFDYFLGMYDARRFVESYSTGALVGARYEVPIPIQYPEPPVDEIGRSTWRKFYCMRGVFDDIPELQNLCRDRDLYDFSILMRMSIDRLYDHCSRLPRGHVTTEGHPFCDAAALGEDPPAFTGQPALADGRWRSQTGESEVRYVLRLLSEYGFHFHDLGLTREESDRAVRSIRAALLDILTVFSSHQPGDAGTLIRAAAYPLMNVLGYIPPDRIYYFMVGTMLESGGSFANLDSTWLPLWIRLNLATTLQGVGTLLSSERAVVALTPLIGADFELSPVSGPTFQWRLGARTGFQLSTGDLFLFRPCDADAFGGNAWACSRPTTQYLVVLSIWERLRFQFMGEWLPPFRGDRSGWTLGFGAGIQLLPPF